MNEKITSHLKSYGWIYVILSLGVLWIVFASVSSGPKIKFISYDDANNNLNLSIDRDKIGVFKPGVGTTASSFKDYTVSYQKFGNNQIIVSAWYDKTKKGTTLVIDKPLNY